MKSSAVSATGTVSPCLLVEDIQGELAFLKTVFGAKVSQRATGFQGTVWQVEVQLGDVTLMIGRAHKDGVPVTAMLYVWIDDVDAVHTRAMAAGATLISAPVDQPSGVREAGFKDPQGNIWWIGRRLKKPSNRDVERRLMEQRRTRL